LKKEIPFLAKKGLEAGCYYASEALRDHNLQKKAINYTLEKARPVFQKVGSEMLDQISTKVRPNRRHKTDRAELDGAGIDIHKAIGKLPKLKRGWTLPGHYYTGPYNPLEQQVNYDPETGQIQHVDYGVCSSRNEKYGENEKNCKHKADKKMVTALDAVPWKQRQWGHAAARDTIILEQKLGLGFKQK